MVGLPRSPGYVDAPTPVVFGGKSAQGFLSNMVDKFHNLEKTYKNSPTLRWQSTGLYRGPDDQLRFEIPDYHSRWKADAPIKGDRYVSQWPEAMEEFDLKELLDHPQLYENYPDLEKLPVIVDPRMEGALGEYWDVLPRRADDPVVTKDAIKLKGGLDPRTAHSTALHELQHWIQSREDFGRGANQRYWRDPSPDLNENANMLRALQEALQMKDVLAKPGVRDPEMAYFEKYGDAWARGSRAEALMRQDRDTLNQLLRDAVRKERTLQFADNPYNLYRRASGEVEARNVQGRMGMNPVTAKSVSPENSQDIPFLDQILLRGSVR